MKLNIQCENEIRLLKTNKESLEKRLATAQTEIEQLSSLKSDFNDSKNQKKALEKQLEELTKKYQRQKTKNKEVEDKFENLQSQVQDMGFQPNANTLRNSERERNTSNNENQSARQFFK